MEALEARQQPRVDLCNRRDVHHLSQEGAITKVRKKPMAYLVSSIIMLEFQKSGQVCGSAALQVECLGVPLKPGACKGSANRDAPEAQACWLHYSCRSLWATLALVDLVVGGMVWSI